MNFAKFYKPRVLLWVVIILFSSGLQPTLANSTSTAKQTKQFIVALEEISEHFQVVFSYETKLLRDIEVDFHFAKNENLKSALDRLLGLTGFQHKAIGDKYFVIYRNDKKGSKNAKKLERKIQQIQKLERKGEVRLERQSTTPRDQFTKVTELIVDMEEKRPITGTVTSSEDGTPFDRCFYYRKRNGYRNGN